MGNSENGGTTPINKINQKNVPTMFINRVGCAIYKTDKTVVTWGIKDIITQVCKKHT